LKTPYAFAFEIYVGGNMDGMLKERWEAKMRDGMGAFYQTNSHLGHEHFHEFFAQNPSDFVQLKAEKHKHRMSDSDCFYNFNPGTKEAYDKTVENWSDAYLDVAEMVSQNIKDKVGQTSM